MADSDQITLTNYPKSAGADRTAADMSMPVEPFLRPSRELAVSRRVLLSVPANHESPFKAVHRSSLAVVPQDDSAALNRGLRPGRLLVRAWRSLMELRIDAALATVLGDPAHFQAPSELCRVALGEAEPPTCRPAAIA